MSGSQTDTIRAAFADIWERNLPLIRQRLLAVERAAAEAAKPSPDSERIELGRAEAHKLVGVLGTFGLSQGTELARGLEGRLQPGPGTDANELMRIAAELRSAIEGAQADRIDGVEGRP